MIKVTFEPRSQKKNYLQFIIVPNFHQVIHNQLLSFKKQTRIKHWGGEITRQATFFFLICKNVDVMFFQRMMSSSIYFSAVQITR